ncbi:MAG: cyclic nucleotide-binding domain-containing protein [Elusimicrobiota bacterium]
MAAEPIRKDIAAEELTWLGRTLDLYVVGERLNPEELIGKLSSLMLFAYPEGAEIVREGAGGQDLFILHKGSASVIRGGKQLAKLEPGDLFGEVAFLVGVPRTATVSAGPGCQAFRCEAKGFEEILSRHPNLLESMRAIAKLRMMKLSTGKP